MSNQPDVVVAFDDSITTEQRERFWTELADGGHTEPLDPRWEWIDVRQFSDPGPRYIRGRCRHTEVVPVEAVSGETVAHLCRTCDTQLPAEWERPA